MALTPMMQQYLSIKEAYKDTLVFFRLGDFYEMFFDDALQASKELEITLTGRDAGLEQRVPMCGVPYHAAEGYIKRLVARGFKIAICEQVEDPAEAKGIVRREVVRVITPGTYLDDGNQESIFIVTIVSPADCPDSGSFSACFVNVITGDVFVDDLLDEEAVVERLLAFQPVELVVTEHTYEQLKASFQQPNLQSITVTLHASLQSAANDQDVLCRQFGSSILEDAAVAGPGIRTACGILLDYIQNTQKRMLPHVKKPQRVNWKDTLILDACSRRNLELTETLRDGKKQGSLFGVIDQTITTMGSRLLKQWLLAPLQRAEAIARRQDAVEELMKDYLIRQDLKPLLRNVYDLERLTAKLSYGTANAKDLIALCQSLEQIPPIKLLIREFQSAEYNGIQKDLCDYEELMDRIAHAIVPDPPISLKDGGLIRDGYHPELDRLRLIAREGKTWIAELEREEREKTTIKSLKIGFNKVFGYYIEVTKTNVHLVPEQYERKQTLANAERYVTAELKQREAEILHAEERLTELEYELFVEVREYIVDHVDTLQRVAHALAKLDVYYALASVAAEHRYVRPVLDLSDVIEIHAGRHPVVEQMLQGRSFVANDTLLNCRDQQIMLITGPNMAGKSTYMRQVALLVILSHIGSFVPASYARIGLVDRVFTRIGAADDLAGGQSTFMVEMVELANILEHATPRSLIVLDEIGRGTSTYDGISIARAVVEYLQDRQQIGAKTLFATHYHELTELGHQLPGVQNFSTHVEDTGDSIIFLRKIIPQPADRSYGIHVAKLAGLPDAVLKRANEILTMLESKGQSGKEVIGELAATATPIQQQEAEAPAQLSLFEGYTKKQEHAKQREKAKEPRDALQEDIIQAIQTLDLIRMTPLEAMNQLFLLQERIQNKNRR
ncbi:DNA mismatch repair protein MutS [Fodinisporobacter ferrooxydans]|uniref:DNA mismatch repair protein MutS n=1 Tax=Fodinisporobacter ferrooxydans TaxID=2901836 RepID=A0ABY4CGA3_9BACL|nr:DNA mismatch repair protein MutS [Alicyclobacillaceae bacterium MYW30-H2]